MNNDFRLGAFARFPKKPSNRHIYFAPICAARGQARYRTSSPASGRAGEESLGLLQASAGFSQTLILTLPGAPPKYAAVFWHSRFGSAATVKIHT
jgi:hypothetical protein